MTEKLKKQVIAPISISASTFLEIRPKIRKRLLDIHTTNLSDSHLLSRKRGFNYVYEVSSKNTELFILFDLVHFKVDILVPYSHNFSSGVSSTSPNSPGKLFF